MIQEAMPRGTYSYKRERGLTIKQENALDLLVIGETDSATAEAVGVARVTVTKWRNYDPHFQAELNRRRQDMWGASVDRLRSLLPHALDALEHELQHGKQRSRVAIEVLRLAGLDRSGPNDSSLETYGVGSRDADVIVDSLARRQRPDPLKDLLNGDPVTEIERLSVIEGLNRQLASD